MSTDTNQITRSMRSRIPWRAIGLLGVVGIAIGLGLTFRQELQPVLEWVEQTIQSMGSWGPPAYVMIYVLWTVAGLPGTPITLVGASAFASSPWVALASVSAGSTLGAAACFLIARRFARDSTRTWAMQREVFAKLDRATETHGVWVVAITRLLPIIPYNLLNYGFGITRVGFWKYLVVSWACMLPATAMYVLGVGSLLGAIRQGKISWGLAVGFGFALIAMLAAAAMAKRSWSKMRGQADFQADEHNNAGESTPAHRRGDPGLE